MNGAEEDGWSAVATEWSELWAPSAEPVWGRLMAATDFSRGARALDVGCGSGELLSAARRRGATIEGIDAAPGMVAVARAREPEADIREGEAEALPWPDRGFDLVTAVNVLQFADDQVGAVREFARVTADGGIVAVANWADDRLNDLTVLEATVAAANDESLPPEGELRRPGGLERLFRQAGMEVIGSGLVEAPMTMSSDRDLVRAVLLGEDEAGMAATREVLLAAAEPFKTGTGGYRLVNSLRFALARRV